MRNFVLCLIWSPKQFIEWRSVTPRSRSDALPINIICTSCPKVQSAVFEGPYYRLDNVGWALMRLALQLKTPNIKGGEQKRTETVREGNRDRDRETFFVDASQSTFDAASPFNFFVQPKT